MYCYFCYDDSMYFIIYFSLFGQFNKCITTQVQAVGKCWQRVLYEYFPVSNRITYTVFPATVLINLKFKLPIYETI